MILRSPPQPGDGAKGGPLAEAAREPSSVARGGVIGRWGESVVDGGSHLC